MGNHGHGLIPILRNPPPLPELQREIRQGKKRKGQSHRASKGQSQCLALPDPPQDLSDLTLLPLEAGTPGTLPIPPHLPRLGTLAQLPAAVPAPASLP